MAVTPIVRHISECFIKPKHETKDATNPIYLGPSELAMMSGHYIQTGLLFSKNQKHNSIESLIESLKNSLSLALAHFYPLAGQFETQVDEDEHTSLIFINCNKGPGARFIHATLDLKIFDLLSPKDVPLVVQSLFDHDRAVNHDGHIRPLLSIQVTDLVDGVFIGCSMNHSCGDGTSFWHFFNMWSEIFMADEEDNIAISRPPIHERWFIDGVGPLIKLPFTNPYEFVTRFEAPKMRERIFRFSSDSVSKLKRKANEEYGSNNNISSFQALSALAWKCITRARNFPKDAETKCIFTINNRVRIDPPLSNNCFGTFIQTVEGKAKVGELLSQSLGWAASVMHQAVVEHTDEMVRGAFMWWVESPFVYQIESHFDPYSVMMGCSPRFNVYGNEFGMGKPLAVLNGYADKFDGKISSFPGHQGGQSIDLQICLLPEFMHALESDKEFMDAVY